MDGERVATQVKHVIKDLIAVLSETLPKSIRIKYDLAPELRVISADPTQIHQVLMNTCLNARDAMPLGGTLRITAENVDIDENYSRMNPIAKPGAYILVKIEDTGTGMSSEVRERIFDPFFTTKELGKGTGLGLSTALSIIKSHDGFIDLVSEPGAGTCFSIYLPSSQADAETGTREDISEYQTGRGELILVVDDERNIREVTKVTLEKFGYRVITASDGTDAIGAYAKNAEDIAAVVTDMAMPILDGPGLISSIKRMNPEMRFIAMSGFQSNEQTAQLESLHVTAVLTKPFTAEKLLTTLADLLRSR
jgi:CheY-like chemotaxis protein